MTILKTKMFLHSDKDTNRDMGEKLGLSDEALGRFIYACYEVEVDLEVNEQTGEARIVAVDGRAVATA